MEGVYLKLYVPEHERCEGKATYDWLLDTAHEIGISGGSAFRAIAGFGRRGRLGEGSVFGELPVEVVFMTSEELARKLMEKIEKSKNKLFYVKTRAECGWLEGG